MTEQLSTLLRTEAAGLDIPPAPADRVLADGRARRRRRRTTTAVVGAAAAVAMVAAGIAVLGTDRNDRAPEPPGRRKRPPIKSWTRGPTATGCTSATMS